MDDQDVMTLLSSEVRAAGSQAAWAREHGIAPAYLSQVLTGRRPPGPSLLAALGLSRRIVIEGVPIQDPRDPDYTRVGMFVLHNCWRCKNGREACIAGNPRQCEYPHARND